MNTLTYPTTHPSIHPSTHSSIHLSFHLPSDWTTISSSFHTFGKSGVGPRSVTTVWKLLWNDCPPVCGSPTRQLCGRANGNIFQEDLCQQATLPRTAAVPRAGHSRPGINTDGGPWGPKRAAEGWVFQAHATARAQAWKTQIWRENAMLPQKPSSGYMRNYQEMRFQKFKGLLSQGNGIILSKQPTGIIRIKT